jgi:energy-coupling factor transport system substrate-specific component
MQDGRSWKPRDVVFAATASIVFGACCLMAVYMGVVTSTALAPMGISVPADEPISGIWPMASAFCACVLRRPGAAVLTGTPAALVEVLLGDIHGTLVLVSGTVQGLGAEIVFLAFRYRDFSLKVMRLASIGAALFSFAWGFIRGGLALLGRDILMAMPAMRLLSSILFSGHVSLNLAKAFQRSGAFRPMAPGRAPASKEGP